MNPGQKAFAAVKEILEYIGEDPEREGLKDTPRRVLTSWLELYGGYRFSGHDVQDLLTTFEGDGYDEMIVLNNIEFFSMCEHHMLPFFGHATIGYIPDNRVVGVSKLARLLEVYSRRLQIQERLTDQVVKAIMLYLRPKGAGCIIKAKHFCMICRGVNKQQSEMVTSSLAGAFREESTRSEFMSFAR